MLTRVLSIITFALGVAFPSATAQEPIKTPRVGFVAPQGRSLPFFDAFKQGLTDHGYIDGKNIIIEARFAEGHYNSFRRFLPI